MAEQYHYEFNQREEAFEQFYRKRLGKHILADDGRVLGFRKGNPHFYFVISTAADVSGYWVEEDAEEDEHTTVYRSVRSVRRLEQRLRRKREATVNVSIGLVT